MGRKWPGADIPESGVVYPDGLYEVAITEIAETTNNSGHLMYKGRFTVVEPATFAGSPYWENFNIGNEGDPKALDPETWKRSIGAQILARVMKASGHALSDDVDEDIAAVTGQHVLVSLVQEIDDGKRDPRYKGRVRNKAVRWYRRGEAEVGLAAPAGAPRSTGPAPRAAAPAPTPAPKAAPAAAKPKAPPATKPSLVSCPIDDCAWEGERRDFQAHHMAEHAADDE